MRVVAQEKLDNDENEIGAFSNTILKWIRNLSRPNPLAI